MDSADDLHLLTSRAGRPFRGVIGIAARCPAGHPAVITCAPLRRERGRLVPFPTLYWLACPQLSRTLATLERDGLIKELEAQIACDAALREAVARDHDDYIALRWAAVSPEDRSLIDAGPLAARFHRHGIGGTTNRVAVKCLHAHFAHHLARGSAIGRWIAERHGVAPCGGAGIGEP